MREIATFAGGCFWCTEAVFKDVVGVEKVESGYTGGTMPDPDYKAVCSGSTGHAEAVQLSFDPDSISYADLLDIFLHTHDPTQLNRQGNDVGTQYRSAIFTHSPEQERLARAALERAQAAWPDPIVTSIQEAGIWYPAEDYHQEYYDRVGSQNAYCNVVISPKLAKFRKAYASRLKSGN
ncbi:peptide methionine sulfoxide reductase MsrA [Sphingomonas changbaiensis NBRC 104936]|uniref:Peptide methionine sulfoxide reductase MsrA n=1 Tax=Sphingomonas changbaiensis NBRC 104936 TaxID=1219043 RepID=A0A0E9MNG3_9SPHN|nr:peptide-methionine (S)-S-oxide reductase MsrA [Sphingomonas changbaiensis]GAO39038.1 peptide methionine sulfoxide reductase MsrA [Sphingomonas changbaiensis NBRC 104936]